MIKFDFKIVFEFAYLSGFEKISGFEARLKDQSRVVLGFERVEIGKFVEVARFRRLVLNALVPVTFVATIIN